MKIKIIKYHAKHRYFVAFAVNNYIIWKQSIISIKVTKPETLAGVEMDKKSNSEGKIHVVQTATAVSVSFMICKTATYLTEMCKIQGGSLPAVTAIVVILATVFPTQFNYLAPAGDTIALVLMQVIKMYPISVCILFNCLF